MSAGPTRPTPTRDLDSPDEIAEMVRRFYQDVAQDDLLGPLFNDVARVDWNEHLPKLTRFWCRALLGIEGYAGNPFRSHASSTTAPRSRWTTSTGGCSSSRTPWSSAGLGLTRTGPSHWPSRWRGPLQPARRPEHRLTGPGRSTDCSSTRRGV